MVIRWCRFVADAMRPSSKGLGVEAESGSCLVSVCHAVQRAFSLPPCGTAGPTDRPTLGVEATVRDVWNEVIFGSTPSRTDPMTSHHKDSDAIQQKQQKQKQQPAVTEQQRPHQQNNNDHMKRKRHRPTNERLRAYRGERVYIHTWWARQMRSRSCAARKSRTMSSPNVNETPRSFSPHPIMSRSGSDHSRSHSKPVGWV